MSWLAGNVHVEERLSAGEFGIPDATVTAAMMAPNANIASTQLAERALQAIPIPPEAWRIHDSMQPLPATSSGDDLGLYPGTHLTTPALIRTEDLKAAGATTKRARCQVMLPYNYVAAGDVKIRANALMITTIADATCTIDFAAGEITGATSSADLVTTGATSMNSVTAANKDFDLTATGLGPGDWLDIVMTIICTDAATVTAVIAAVSKTYLLCDVQ